jgi:hypothetical protein
MTKSPKLEDTKRLMAALGRMPPKPHEEMKLGKPKAKRRKSLGGSKQRSVNVNPGGIDVRGDALKKTKAAKRGS